jgi:uncharacterized membrane protein SpoIIM required for sporulation
VNQDQFVARRQEQWKELAAVLAQTQARGARRLPLEQVQKLGRLYRQTASDLAYARTYFPHAQTTAYLNQLVTQAHNIIYAEEPQRLKTLWRFFAADVPRAVREAWRPLALAAALTLLGAAVGFFAILYDPNLTEALVPEQFQHFAARSKEGQEIFPVEMRALIGTGIMLNNIFVGIRAFGFGITLGIGTALVLFQNGLVVGALAAHFFKAGLSYEFWALIVPHGMLEFMAIFLAGAAGFCLGWPLVAPGELSRREAFTAGAKRGIVLLLGTLPLFVAAAIIEGWVTPMTSLPNGGKYGVAAVTLILGLAYWCLPGRGGKKATAFPAP